MHPRSPKLLEDIHDAAAFIREVAQGKALTDYQRDRMLRQAVERNFEIIGEALKRLAQHDPQTASAIIARSLRSAMCSFMATIWSITRSSGAR